MRNQLITPLLVAAIILTACKVNKKPLAANTAADKHVNPIPVSQAPHQPTADRLFNMQHLRLQIGFDYQKQHALGKATLWLKPHFYPQHKLVLDAKQFILHRVALISGFDTVSAKYQYDNFKLSIELGKTYTKDETVQVFIHYTAQPNQIKSESKQAISDAKGLYFINPTRSISDKPRQIWTQGEPQSNSGWVPLIDEPNQKLTQELFITVDEKDVTLSNGELMYSKSNNNGTRTDYWKQTLPHAPYLIMMAIGEFEITKDYWRDSVEVNYYLEKNYTKYAHMIFGKTPQMIECFSKKTGVDYPWDKYSQVVVRDFVSGAMENTGAVIHYDAVQHDSLEHLDNDHEDIIAHELFHHWFGDLVTCESWSNITVNESFATYGEYIWNECAYDKNTADYHFTTNLSSYLRQRKKHDAPLVRHHYNTPNDVFDVVSYQKGSRILHMLRDEVGEEAFFASLKHYLTKHKFGTAEATDLRLAFEHVTGRDLNWFFNQWYTNAGHPDLVIKVNVDSVKKNAAVITLKQMQDSAQYGMFKLPIDIVIKTQDGQIRDRVYFDNRSKEISMVADNPIQAVIVDPNHVLLANKEEEKSFDLWYNQFKLVSDYMSKKDALYGAIKSYQPEQKEKLVELIRLGLADPFFGVREHAMLAAADFGKDLPQAIKEMLIYLAKQDNVANNRATALSVCVEALDDQAARLVCNGGLSDSSLRVNSVAVRNMAKLDLGLALGVCEQIYITKHPRLLPDVAAVYALSKSDKYVDFYTSHLTKGSKYQHQILRSFGNYLLGQEPQTQVKGIAWLKNYNSNAHPFYRGISLQAIKLIETDTKERIEKLNKEAKATKIQAEKDKIKSEVDAMQKVLDAISN